MKAIHLVALALLVSVAHAQGPPETTMRSSFAAVIVSDFDASLEWYQQVLGFEVVNRRALPERGIFQANLQREGADLEILALASAVDPSTLSEEVDEKTRFQGLFKIGFTVTDFSEWLEWFEAKAVEFHGDVVADPQSGKRMVILRDPDGNRVQIFEE